MVEHTLRALLQVPRLTQVMVVLAPTDAHFATLVAPAILHRVQSVRRGGETRAQTVVNGLNSLLDGGAGEHDWVLVHDAARCLIEPRYIDALIDACLVDEVGGLLALPLADTLKQARDMRCTATVDRRDKWLAQTPQMFKIGTLRRALAAAGADATDEASAIERLGLQPMLVRGHPMNFKVTWPDEIELAERWIKTR